MEKEIQEKVLRREIYKVKTPKKILIGDPLYFEEYTGEKLKCLVAAYMPPDFFSARVVLTEIELMGFSKETVCAMDIHLAQEPLVDIYAKGMMCQEDEIISKDIGVDTAEYIMEVDGRQDIVYTGSDGYWGVCEEFSYKENTERLVRGVSIRMSMPEFDSYDDVKRRVKYLFEDVQKIQEKPKKMSKGRKPER